MKVIQFQKINGDKFVVTGFSPALSDLVALLSGIKPLIYLSAEANHLKYVRKLIHFFDLKYSVAGEEKLSPVPGKSMSVFFISKNDDTLKKAVALWRSRAFTSVAWGELLGYPK